jgi:hypothetical protein
MEAGKAGSPGAACAGRSLDGWTDSLPKIALGALAIADFGLWIVDSGAGEIFRKSGVDWEAVWNEDPGVMNSRLPFQEAYSYRACGRLERSDRRPRVTARSLLLP